MNTFKAIYIKPTEKCNLDCLHCFISNERKKSNNFLSIDDIKKIGKKIIKGTKNLEIIWHGGEPTLMGKSYISSAVRLLNSIAEKNGVHLKHSLQTNLTLVDESWHEILKDYFESRVGTSYDPDMRFLQDTEWEKNIEKLKQSNIHVSVTLTMTKPLAKKGAKYLLNLLMEIGCPTYHLERFTPRGEGAQRVDEYYLNSADFYNYLHDLALEYKNYSKSFFLSPFSAMKREMSFNTGIGCWQGQCLTDVLTVNPDGFVSSCPDLAVDENFYFGNILTDPLEDILMSHKRVKLIAFQRSNICDCKYGSVCNGGCPLHNMLWRGINLEDQKACMNFFTFIEGVQYDETKKN